jgi:cytochrome P450
MEKEFQKLTFDVIGIVALGVDFRSQELDESAYEQAWHTILTHLMFLFYFPLPLWCWKYLRFIPAVQRFNQAMELIDSMVFQTIKHRSAEEIDAADSSILAHMLRERAQNPAQMSWLSDVQIRNELITLLFAGHDTTTSLVTWALVG